MPLLPSASQCPLRRRFLAGLAATVVLVLSLWTARFIRPALLIGVDLTKALEQYSATPSNIIVDRNGRVLYRWADPDTGYHQPLVSEEIPVVLRQAIVATEDATFYANPGISPKAMLRALWLNAREGCVVSGASTITQQVARGLLMAPAQRHRQSWLRKAREGIMALQLTCRLSKDEILTLYLDQTYFGHFAYGVGSAAQIFFGKPVSQLDLAESALLAGLPQAPSLYDPFGDLPAAKRRQRTVLGLMVKAGYITRSEADLSYREPLHLAGTALDIEAPHFVEMVRKELDGELGEDTIHEGGLRIVTTLDLDLQHAAERAIAQRLARLALDDGPPRRVTNAAIVLLDPLSGAVGALVGSADYGDQEIGGAVNVALARRQPGSAIKPLTYAAAFERGYSPASILEDEAVAFQTAEGEPYRPINYDYQYHGRVSLRSALACSYNVVAVKLLDAIGTEALIEMAGRLGISHLGRSDSAGLALTLGSGEVRLFDLAAAYGAIANGGRRVYPRIIDRVENAAGETLYAPPRQDMQRVLDERIAFLVTDILSDNDARIPAFGENSPLQLPFPAAAKTGTTTDWRDNWTVGYTTEWVAGVWVGNASGEPMRHVTGVTGAAPIWNAVMRSAHVADPRPFLRPEGLVEASVCTDAARDVETTCPGLTRELFLDENAPGLTAKHRPFRSGGSTANAVPPAVDAERSASAEAGSLSDSREPDRENALVPKIQALMSASGQEESGPRAESDLQSQAPIRDDPDVLRLVEPAQNSRFAMVSDLPASFQQIEVAADVPSTMTEVTLLIDGALWHRWEAPPYATLWPLAPGAHRFVLIGTRRTGESVQVVSRIQVSSTPSG